MKKLQEYMEDLSYYKNCKKSRRCDLDSRYFEKIFRRYPGIKNPVLLTIKDKKYENKDTGKEKVLIFHTERNKPVDKSFIGIARLTVIVDEDTRYSNLLIFDYNQKILTRISPLGNTTPYFEDIGNFLKQMKKDDYELITINPTMKPSLNPTCDIGGYSVAYCIFYAYSFLTGFPFEPEYIKSLVSFIKVKIMLPKDITPEVEYDLFGDDNEEGASANAVGGVI